MQKTLVEAPAKSAASADPRRLDLSTKLFYGSGSIAFGVKDNGFSYLLLIFYNQVVGLSAAAVGLAIMIAMVFDAFLDPIVGQASDNTRSRWGRRHPYMYAAALPVALTYFALWNPPHWGQRALFFYLIVSAIIIRTFISFYEVPSSALSAELTKGYDERTVLLSFRYFFGWIGGLTLNLIAFAVLLRPDATHKVGQLNPAGYARYGIVAAAVMFVAILISAIGTHRHIPSFTVPPKRRLGLLAMAREMISTWSHRSFLMLTLSGLATAMAAGIGAAMNNYFNTFFWEFTARQIAIFTAGVFASAILALIGAPILSRKFGKRPSAMGLIALSVTVGVAPLLLRLAGFFPPNHTILLLVIIFFTSITSTALGIAGSTMVSAMIADVVEDSELKTGRRAEGLFFSASSLIAKAVSGVGVFAAGLILAAIRFPNLAKPGHVAAPIIAHLAMVYVPIIAALYGTALVLMLGYKITRKGHLETLAELAARAEIVSP
ncbi:MAG: MFS transporter [Caulobacteraceae bacterium]